MTGLWLRMVRSVRDFARGAWRALPWETSLTVGAAACLMALASESFGASAEEALVRGLLACVLAVPMSFTITLIARSTGLPATSRHALSAIVTAFAATWTVMKLDFDHAHDSPVIYPYGLLLVAVTLLPFWAGVPRGPRRAERFSGFLCRFCQQTGLFGLLAVAAGAAFATVFAAVRVLFELRLGEQWLAHGLIAIGAASVVAWLFRLLPSGRGVEVGEVPELWTKLASLVCAPFVVIMLGLVAVYELSLLARGELPSNIVSPFILATGFAGFFMTLVARASSPPTRADDGAGSPLTRAARADWTEAPTLRLARVYPAVLLPLLPVACYALYLRIDQYGLTPLRVLRIAALAALAHLCVLGALRLWRRRSPVSWHVPAALATAACLCAVGPLSAINWSARSQRARIDTMLTLHGVTDRRVIPGRQDHVADLAWDDYTTLSSAINSVARWQPEALDEVLDGDTEPCKSGWSADECLRGLGIVSVP